jgi:hypothetical protein
MHARGDARANACVRSRGASGRGCMHEWLRSCARACVHARASAGTRTCWHAHMRACSCVRLRTSSLGPHASATHASRLFPPHDEPPPKCIVPPTTPSFQPCRGSGCAALMRPTQRVCTGRDPQPRMISRAPMQGQARRCAARCGAIDRLAVARRAMEQVVTLYEPRSCQSCLTFSNERTLYLSRQQNSASQPYRQMRARGAQGNANGVLKVLAGDGSHSRVLGSTRIGRSAC